MNGWSMVEVDGPTNVTYQKVHPALSFVLCPVLLSTLSLMYVTKIKHEFYKLSLDSSHRKYQIVNEPSLGATLQTCHFNFSGGNKYEGAINKSRA